MKRKLLVTTLVVFSSFHAIANLKALNNLSWEERFYLRCFFSSFIKEDNLGHVIYFNTKPACFGGFITKYEKKTFQEVLLLKGWLCWKKNEHLFPHPHFIFVEEKVDHREMHCVDIIVINKESFLSTLITNKELFKKILGSNFSPAGFLEEVERTKSLRSLLNHDESLFGL